MAEQSSTTLEQQPLHQRAQATEMAPVDPPVYTSAMRAHALMTGTVSDDWSRMPVPYGLRISADHSAGIPTDAVSELSSTHSQSPGTSFMHTTVEEVEMDRLDDDEKALLPRSRNMPPTTAPKRQWTSGIRFRPNELVRPDELQELAELLDGDLQEAEEREKHKRRMSRRATSTVYNIGRNVKLRLSSLWRKRDSADHSPPMLITDGAESDDNDVVSTLSEYDACVENLIARSEVFEAQRREISEATSTLSPSYEREDGGPLAPCHTYTSRRPSEKDTVNGAKLPITSDAPPAYRLRKDKPVAPDPFLPQLSDHERVSYSQLHEQMTTELSQALHNGRLDEANIKKHFESLYGNRTNPSDQAKASELLRMEIEQERDRMARDFRIAEAKREAEAEKSGRDLRWLLGWTAGKTRQEQGSRHTRVVSDAALKILMESDGSGSAPDAALEIAEPRVRRAVTTK